MILISPHPSLNLFLHCIEPFIRNCIFNYWCRLCNYCFINLLDFYLLVPEITCVPEIFSTCLIVDDEHICFCENLLLSLI